MGILKQSENHTNKPNFLINIERPKTLTSNKIYNQFLKVVLSQYDFEDKQGIQDNRFFLKMDDLRDSCNISKTKNYDFIFENIDLLLKKQITILEEYKKKDKPDEKKLKKISRMNLISAWSGEVEDGHIFFEMPNMLLDHLKQLKEGKNLIYTQLNDKFINNFKHSHTVALYELMKEYQKVYKMKMSYTELRKNFGLDKKQYAKPTDFKRYVLVKALDEIMEQTDIDFDYEIKKERNKEREIEYFLLVNFKETKQISFNIFKKSFLHAAKGNDLTMKSKEYKDRKPLTINKKGYIVEKNGTTVLSTEEASKVWQSLYFVFNSKPENIFGLLSIEQSEFEDIIDFFKG